MVNIYELLNRIIVNKRYSLSPNLFIEADRTELSEEERSIFDLLKNIVSLGTKIHNDGIEFYPMFVMADLEYVIGCMHDTNTKITNIKAYMVTALYNAPSTMNHYYQQEVQHDMYGGGWHEKGIV